MAVTFVRGSIQVVTGPTGETTVYAAADTSGTYGLSGLLVLFVPFAAALSYPPNFLGYSMIPVWPGTFPGDIPSYSGWSSGRFYYMVNPPNAGGGTIQCQYSTPATGVWCAWVFTGVDQDNPILEVTQHEAISHDLPGVPPDWLIGYDPGWLVAGASIGSMLLGLYEINDQLALPTSSGAWDIDPSLLANAVQVFSESYNWSSAPGFPVNVFTLWESWVGDVVYPFPIVHISSAYRIMYGLFVAINPTSREFTIDDVGVARDDFVIDYKMMEETGVGVDAIVVDSTLNITIDDTGVGVDSPGNAGPVLIITDEPEAPVPLLIQDTAIATASLTGWGRHVAVAPSGRIWVVYRKWVYSSIYDIYAAYSDDDGATWTEELLCNAGYPSDEAIAVDSSGNVHVVYSRQGVGTYTEQDQIVYRKRTTSWAAEELVTDYDYYYGQLGCSIAVDSSADVYVAWAGEEADASWSQGLFKKRTSGVWGALERLTAETEVNIYGVLVAVSDDGSVVHVVYDHDDDYGYTIHYRRKSGGTWATEEDVFVSTAYGDYYDTYDGYDMAIDSGGDAHVVASHYSEDEEYNYDMIVAYRRRNGSWAAEVNVSPSETQNDSWPFNPQVAPTASGDIQVVFLSDYYPAQTYPEQLALIQTIYTDGAWQEEVVVLNLSGEEYRTVALALSGVDLMFIEDHNGDTPRYKLWYGGLTLISSTPDETFKGVDEVIVLLEPAPSFGAELAHGADAVFITRGMEHEEGPPEIEQYHETMIHPHKSKLYAGFIKPRVIWRGTVLTTRGMESEDDEPVAHDLIIHIDSGDYGNVAGFDVLNFMPDLTAWVSVVAGDKKHGKCRVRHFEANGYDLHVACDMACFWWAGDIVEITDRHDLWPKLHRVEADGDDFDIWMDWDLTDDVKDEYPVPVFGSDRCAFFDVDFVGSGPPVPSYSVTLAFDASLSFLVQPDSQEYEALGWDDQGITAWDWWFEGADTPTASGKQVTATYTTIPPDGHYVVRLTVTGRNALTEIGFRDVLLFEHTVAPPITTFEIKRFGGSLESRGWEAEVDVFDTLYNPSVLEDGTKAIIFAEEWYGDNPRADFPMPSAIHGDGNIKLVGWTTQTAMSYDSETLRSVTIAIRGLQSYMESYSNNATQWSMVDSAEPPWVYFSLLTTRKALYHLLKWYWTIYRFTDVTFPDDHNNSVGGAIFPEGSLGSQLDEFVKNVQARWTCDCKSRLNIFSWPNWLPVNGAGAAWRNRFHRDTVLYNRDVKHVDITPRVSRDASRVRVEGVVQWSETDFGVVVDTAPGDIRQLAGDVFVQGSQWLGTGGFEQDANGNESQGYELAKMIYAEQTRPIEKVSLPMNGNYGMFDIQPETMYFLLSFHPKQVLRDIDWTLKPFWCTGVEYAIDVEAGTVNTKLTALPETWETPGVGVWSQYGPDGKEKDWLPHSGSAKSVRALRTVNSPDGRIIPATMTLDSARPGTAIVRLYNDPAQTVVAECKNYKIMSGRPVHVEINNRRSSNGRPGQQVYTVVGVREAQTDVEETKDQRGYITRQAVLCFSGTQFPTAEAAPPLPVQFSPVQALSLVGATSMPFDIATTFTVLKNAVTLGTITFNAGALTAVGTLVAEQAFLVHGDILHLVVASGTGTGVGSVTVGCKEYGL